MGRSIPTVTLHIALRDFFSKCWFTKVVVRNLLFLFHRVDDRFKD